MDKIIGDFLDQLKVGRKQTYRNLAFYLFSVDPVCSVRDIRALTTGLNPGR